MINGIANPHIDGDAYQLVNNLTKSSGVVRGMARVPAVHSCLPVSLRDHALFLPFGFEGYLPKLCGLSFSLFRFDLFSDGRTADSFGELLASRSRFHSGQLQPRQVERGT